MINFTVIGTAQPQGSSRAFVVRDKATGKNRAIVTADNAKNKPWRQEVAGCAMVAMSQAGEKIIARPAAVRVEAKFYFDRPKVAKGKEYKATRPDADKLLRSIGDALTGICYEDDSQISIVTMIKLFGSPARAVIRVSQIYDAVLEL